MKVNNIKIRNYDKHIFNKFEYIVLRSFYKSMSKIGKILAKISPTRRIMRFFCHKVESRYYRKCRILDMIYINQHAETWYCNNCGKVVFKGIVNKWIVLNCPHCNAIYQVTNSFEDKLGRRTTAFHNSKKEREIIQVQEETIIDNGVRYGEKIMGIEYFIEG